MNRVKSPLRVFLLVLVLLPSLACADDVTDSMNEALQQYNDGAYSDAAVSLTYALQLIQQKKSGELETLLPEPLKEWDAEPASSETSPAVLGGGISVTRRYNKDDSSISINLMTDSPMLQGVMMFFSNPMFAQADGGKMIKVGKEKAIMKYVAKDKSGELTIVVDNRILVKVSGNNITSDELMAYANAIDYEKIQALP